MVAVSAPDQLLGVANMLFLEGKDHPHISLWPDKLKEAFSIHVCGLSLPKSRVQEISIGHG